MLITDLPLDILTLFAVHLSDITPFRRVCRRFRKATHSKLLWKQKALLYTDERTFHDLPGSTWYQKYVLISIGIIKREKESNIRKRDDFTQEVRDQILILNLKINALLTKEKAVQKEAKQLSARLDDEEILLRKNLLAASLGLPRHPRVVDVQVDYHISITDKILINTFANVNEFDIMQVRGFYTGYVRSFIVCLEGSTLTAFHLESSSCNGILPAEAQYVLKKLRIRYRDDVHMIYGRTYFDTYCDDSGRLCKIKRYCDSQV